MWGADVHRWLGRPVTGKFVWRVTRFVLFSAFAVVSAAGLLRAWTAQGTVNDRRSELVRLHEQLLEQQGRGEQLQSRLEAFDTRSDVRIQAIRTELGMLRDNERFFIFK